MVLTAFVAMVAAAIVASQRSSQSANYFWTEAVLHSLPIENVDSSLATKFYAKAVLQTSAPANIYIAWGDFLRGPVPISHALMPLNDEEYVAQVIINPDNLDSVVDNFQSILKGDDQCVAAYTAAAAADPTNPLAHFRLAVFGDREAGLRSAKWLTTNDPQNALGPYLEAARLIKTNPELALPLVQLGNERSALLFYADPTPVSAGNRFPKFFGEFSGRSVSDTAIELLVQRQNTWFEYADPLRRTLESLRDKLFTLADNCADPQSDAAIVAHHAFCHKLVFNSSANLRLIFPGLLGSNESFGLVRWRLAANSAEVATASAEHEEISRFRKLLKTMWRPRHDEIWETSSDSVLSGRVNPVQLELMLVREIQLSALKQEDNPSDKDQTPRYGRPTIR